MVKKKREIEPDDDMLRLHSQSCRGFTLIELLVVISIIGVLSTVAMTSLNAARAKARDAKRLQEIEQIKSALDLYYANNGYYPLYNVSTIVDCNTATSLNALVTSGLFASVPVDPRNTHSSAPFYCYTYIGLGNAANYAFTTSWRCDGHLRTDYLWSLYFSTEATPANFFVSSNANYKYCIHGPLVSE